jgi:two-component system, OmpR family, alkaline phosphatase synthesis response regulator PhoP
MNRQKTVLVVEDDEALMLGLTENLGAAGYKVLKAVTGPEGQKLALDRKPDLIILDVMLPGVSGYEVCRSLREKKLRMPIVMLTARADEFDKLVGFDMGADDYVTKPFSVKELLARVRAMLAREERSESLAAKYTFAECVLDLESRTLTRAGKDVPLTRTEFDLLAYFLAHEGKSMSRDLLLRDVWGLEYLGTQRSLDTFVAMLRAKIEANPKSPKHILTIHGVGYKFATA